MDSINSNKTVRDIKYYYYFQNANIFTCIDRYLIGCHFILVGAIATSAQSCIINSNYSEPYSEQCKNTIVLKPKYHANRQ